MNSNTSKYEGLTINEDSILQEKRLNFINNLNQHFLSAKGYGVWAHFPPKTVLALFDSYLAQHLSDTDYIRSILRHPIRL